MEPENWESLENDFTNTFKKDKFLSNIFYLRDEHDIRQIIYIV